MVKIQLTSPGKRESREAKIQGSENEMKVIVKLTKDTSKHSYFFINENSRSDNHVFHFILLFEKPYS